MSSISWRKLQAGMGGNGDASEVLATAQHIAQNAIDILVRQGTILSELYKHSLVRVATKTSVDMKTAGKTTLYTVPTGKIFYPFAVIVRTTSASLAGGTEYDFGTGANCDTWVQNVNLSTMTTLGTDYWIITGTTKFQNCVVGAAFGIKVITGATNAATATIDVIGYLTDT